MTDCFPTGSVGLAGIGALCRHPDVSAVFSDSGVAGAGAGAGANLDETYDACIDGGYDGVVTASGNCASKTYSGPCTQGDVVCYGNTAVSSAGASFWHTFAHEVGHNLGGPHTFGSGGLMDYNDERALFDDGERTHRVTASITYGHRRRGCPSG